MKVDAAQLNAQLKRAQQSGQLPACYTISSDEPLLSIEAADAIRQAALQSGISAREVFTMERGTDLAALTGAFAGGSLFGDRTLVEIRIPTGKLAKDATVTLLRICDWLKTGQTDAMAMVMLPRLNAKSMQADWVQALMGAGVWVNAPVIEARGLPRWIEDRSASLGLRLEKGCAQWLADHVEGNLIAARQELEKLVLLADGQPVTLALAQSCVANVARYNVFDLGLAMLGGQTDAVLRMLDGLQAEGEAPTLVLWTISEEIRNLHNLQTQLNKGVRLSEALKLCRLWGPKADIIDKARARLSGDRLVNLTHRAAHADRAIKGLLREDAWHLLRALALDIAGLPAPNLLEPS